ncbi:hypothetical protein MTR_4g055735 [Medicago truncatula]|uniref:Uncharacterized protein n=1 Tax=Medicago truncatula TaxID=3880 RepID=A0A072UJJ7_MEDTR|nr:hypothetical protein MTR_4g055735 [Medicago truncatula]
MLYPNTLLGFGGGICELLIVIHSFLPCFNVDDGIALQETLPFARGKIPVKRTKSLGNATFVREKARGRRTRKSTHRKHFARGYTPGRKTRG